MKSESPAAKSFRSRSSASSSAAAGARESESRRVAASPAGEGGEAGGDVCASASPWPPTRRWALVVREPVAVYEVEAEPAVSWPWEDVLEDVAYSIRIPEPAGPARCARCQTRFSAAGPTGYAEDRPICDMCLLEGSSQLGMVMALVAVVRAFGAVRPSSHQDYREALSELGAFSRIYERFAAKSGPPRVFRIPSFEVDL